MKKIIQIIGVLLAFVFIIHSLKAQESTRVFENGSDKLIVYTNVPGLAPSEFYKIRVRQHWRLGRRPYLEFNPNSAYI